MAKTTVIKQEAFIPATPEEVYDAFLDGKKHSEFTGSKAVSSAKVGAKFSTWEGYSFGKNLELVKGRRIVQEWKTTEWPKGMEPSIFELTLVPSKGGTLLKMVHLKVPAEQADEYRQGWIDYYWEPLKKYFKK